mgnify:CR=1 FL=1
MMHWDDEWSRTLALLTVLAADICYTCGLLHLDTMLPTMQHFFCNTHNFPLHETQHFPLCVLLATVQISLAMILSC